MHAFELLCARSSTQVAVSAGACATARLLRRKIKLDAGVGAVQGLDQLSLLPPLGAAHESAVAAPWGSAAAQAMKQCLQRTHALAAAPRRCEHSHPPCPAISRKMSICANRQQQATAAPPPCTSKHRTYHY